MAAFLPSSTLPTRFAALFGCLAFASRASVRWAVRRRGRSAPTVRSLQPGVRRPASKLILEPNACGDLCDLLISPIPLPFTLSSAYFVFSLLAAKDFFASFQAVLIVF